MTPYDPDRDVPLRVLFVEDSEDDVLLILRHLRKHGIDPVHRRVETASGMRKTLEEEGWHLILADYNLPRFSAPKALETLHELELDIPFIVVSGTIGEQSAVDLMRSGAHDFVLKDNPARLVPAIERELREARDRARRREAEEDVRSANARLRRLLAGSPVVIYSARRSGGELTTSYVSESVEEHFGHPASAFVDDPGFWRDHIHPQDRERVLELFDERLPPGGAEAEYRFRDADGEYRWVRDGFEVVDEENGEGREIVGYLLDISGKKEAERELRRSEEQLRQSQKLEAVGRLAGGMAHDFNNILTVVGGHADLLLDVLPEESEARRDALEIRMASKRAAALTRQLLAFARKQVLEPRTVDLNARVREIIEMLKRVLGDDVQILLDLADQPQPVHVDPVQIEQVVLNLALNAQNAMPGGGRLALRTHGEPGSGQGPAGPGGTSVLQVEDTGEGMPPEVRDQIFDPFFTTRDEGSGLGLATVYGIVEQSGGTIEVESEVDEGTTFTLRLPRAEVCDLPESQERRVEARKEPVSEEARTILVVEDDDSLRPLFRRVLQRQDYRVVATPDPEEALELLDGEEHGPALLIADAELPGMSGSRLVREVHDRRPEVQTLLVSGYSHEEIGIHELPEELRNFLPKPFTPDELLDAVRRLLNGT